MIVSETDTADLFTSHHSFGLCIWAQHSDGLSSSPNLLFSDLLQLTFKVFAVGLAAVEFERVAGLGAILYRLVECLEHWPVHFLKDRSPVECPAASSCRARLRQMGYGMQ